MIQNLMDLRSVPRWRAPGIVWPAPPHESDARMLALQFQYRQTEYWPPPGIEAQQFRQIEALVAFCHENIPFWRDRLRRAGLRPGMKLDQRAWARLPILSRREAQEAGKALRAKEPPPGHGNVHEGGTSGSTGVPLRFATSDLAQFFWLSMNLRQALWHNVASGAGLAVIKQIGAGQDVPTTTKADPDWGAGFEAFATGPLLAIDSRRPAAEQIDWLIGHRPAYLMTRPSNAIRLARRCLETGQRLTGLKQIFTMGERLTEETRALCREALDAGMIDAYSSEEAGLMALQCPDHNHLHVVAEAVKVEVLDERGQPCAPGEIGRVVVTPLHNFAMPLLRYELGDQAEVGAACSCGRTLPVLSRILGRANNRIILPGGEVRIAHWGAELMHQISGIIQYQVAQVAEDEIEYRLVVRNPLTADDEAFLTGMLHRSVGYKFKVRFTYVDDIPPMANGKHQEFVAEWAPDQPSSRPITRAV
jgi:phenylacetate-CoA ligase